MIQKDYDYYREYDNYFTNLEIIKDQIKERNIFRKKYHK